MDPIRTTPIHPVARRARRPRSSRSASGIARGSSLATTNRWPSRRARVRAVREGVGVIDASTLGKIEVVGPDARIPGPDVHEPDVEPAVGSIRYGLMLGLDGMVLDDGVAMRLTEDATW